MKFLLLFLKAKVLALVQLIFIIKRERDLKRYKAEIKRLEDSLTKLHKEHLDEKLAPSSRHGLKIAAIQEFMYHYLTHNSYLNKKQ